MWIFHIYVATFQQHLQMGYTSLSWNDVRFHQDRLHEFYYPLSCLCYKWTLICLVCTDCRSFYLSSLMTCHHVWHITAVGVNSIINATCGTRPYVSSWAFVSNSSFNGAHVAQTLVSNEDHYLAFVLSLSLFDLCPSVYWFWLHRCCLPTFLMLIGSQIVIVFSTDFIFCSYLYSNQITSIQEGAFNNLTSLTYL